MAYVRNIKIRNSRGGPCGENCNCPGDPGCPDGGSARGYRTLMGMGDFDPIQNCVDSHPGDAAGAQACINVVSGGGGSPSGSASSPGGGQSATGSILGGVLSFLMPKPAGIVYPPGYSPPMSDTTKIALLGGGALVLVLLLRKKEA